MASMAATVTAGGDRRGSLERNDALRLGQRQWPPMDAFALVGQQSGVAGTILALRPCLEVTTGKRRGRIALGSEVEMRYPDRFAIDRAGTGEQTDDVLIQCAAVSKH